MSKRMLVDQTVALVRSFPALKDVLNDQELVIIIGDGVRRGQIRGYLDYHHRDSDRVPVGYERWANQLASTRPHHLRSIIKNHWPGLTVVQDKSFDWLTTGAEAMSLSVYVEELRLAVEYHGRMFSRPMTTWGEGLYPDGHPNYDQDPYQQRLRLAKLKRERCDDNGVRLAIIPLVDADMCVGDLLEPVIRAASTVYVLNTDAVAEFGLPSQSLFGDAGYDLCAAHDVVIAPGEMVGVGTNIYVDCPYDVYAHIIMRSSLVRMRCTTEITVLDPGYRGEYKLYVTNGGQSPVTINRGERCAQVVFPPRSFLRLVPSGFLSWSERGNRGYGSTGKV